MNSKSIYFNEKKTLLLLFCILLSDENGDENEFTDSKPIGVNYWVYSINPFFFYNAVIAINFIAMTAL